jgi:hypothetical protein
VDDFSREHLAEQIRRLWALPRSVTAALIRRGISPASIAEAVAILNEIGGVTTPEDAVAASFRPRSATQPKFGVGRFGDGSYPVFYAALDEKTCIEEVKNRIEAESTTDPYARHFFILECRYEGLTLILIGHERAHPELTSETQSGYPFCQTLAARARNEGIDAFHTRSARWSPGTCVPVFSERSLRNPVLAGSAIISSNASGTVVAQK